MIFERYSSAHNSLKTSILEEYVQNICMLCKAFIFSLVYKKYSTREILGNLSIPQLGKVKLMKWFSLECWWKVLILSVMDSMDRVLTKIKKWQELSETFVCKIELVLLTLQLHKTVYSQRYFTAEKWYASVNIWKLIAF